MKMLAPVRIIIWRNEELVWSCYWEESVLSPRSIGWQPKFCLFSNFYFKTFIFVPLIQINSSCMVDIWCPHGIRVLSFPIRGKPLSRGFQRKASPQVREPFRIGVQQQLEIRKIWFCWWPILTHISNFKMYLSNKGLLGEWCVWAVIGSYLHPLNSQETWELGNDGIRKEGRCKKYELLWKRIMNFEMDLTPLFLKYINWISFRSVGFLWRICCLLKMSKINKRQ